MHFVWVWEQEEADTSALKSVTEINKQKELKDKNVKKQQLQVL